jgi:segregation and condensation protein B
MEIESIRGVNIDGVTKHLTDLGLIKIEGRKEVPGRPFLYITTRKFLEYFGLNALKDLPKLEDFVALAKKENVDNTLTDKQIPLAYESHKDDSASNPIEDNTKQEVK